MEKNDLTASRLAGRLGIGEDAAAAILAAVGETTASEAGDQTAISAKRSWTWSGRVVMLAALVTMASSGWIAHALSTTTSVGVSSTIPFRGHLNFAGAPVDGTADIEVALYDAPTDGTRVWGPEAHADVPVAGGAFSILVGSNLDLTDAGLAGNRWIQVSVNGTALTGRQLLASAAYARRGAPGQDFAVDTDLTVGGATTAGSLAVTGATTTSSLEVAGAAAVGGTANVTGDLTAGSNVSVTGNVTANDVTANNVTLNNLTNCRVCLNDGWTGDVLCVGVNEGWSGWTNDGRLTGSGTHKRIKMECGPGF